MTKAERILALHTAGHTPRMIAEIVYGLPANAKSRENDRMFAYIRVVLRQRTNPHYAQSEIDRRWRENMRADPIRYAAYLKRTAKNVRNHYWRKKAATAVSREDRRAA